MVDEINRLAINECRPDLVLLLDLDPEVGLRRIHSRGGSEGDNFEKEDLAFQTRMREGFLRAANELPEAFLVLDASKSAEEVWQQAAPVVKQWLEAL